MVGDGGGCAQLGEQLSTRDGARVFEKVGVGMGW